MPRTIRVLHILYSFSAGGLENGIVHIVNGSPEHLRHEICLLTLGGAFLQRLERPIPFHELAKKPGNDPGILLRLKKLISQRRIDIVHTHNWAAFDGVLASCLTPGTVVIHGEHGRDIQDPYGAIKRRNLLRRLMAFRVRKFVAVSRDLQRWLEQKVRIPASKVVYIPNGVDTRRFQPHRDSELRAELGIRFDEFVVGTIGRLDPVKNHEGLIAAAAILAKENRPVRLVVVGDGPNLANLQSLLCDFPSWPKPLLAGFRRDVERFYGVFDVFAMNSFAEGMSNTVLEAMASGLPIVCTPVGANVDLVTNDHNGKYVCSGAPEDVARRINEYLCDPDLRKLHGERTRSFVASHHSLAAMVDRYVNLYESVFHEVI